METIDPPQMASYNKKSGSNNTQSPREQIATNVKGTVKWFHRVRGFGFVTRDDTNEDVFVHYTSLKPVSINLMRAKKRLNLIDKEKVQFDVVQTAEGYEAVNVVGKNGYLILDIIAYKRDIPPFDLEIINDARVTGKVKWFNVKIKYGFIHCDYNNEDVFVHSSAIIKNNPSKYKPSLSENEPVEFDILKRADGKLEAVNVSGPQGLNVQGSRYSPDKKQNVLGKVKWFNVKAGFGFINRNDNGLDVYAHYSSIVNKNPNHRVRSLADGELVMFNIIQGSKGAEASDITGANGGTVQGSEYARPKNLNKSQPSMPYRGKVNEISPLPLNNHRRERNMGINGGGGTQNSYRNQRQSNNNMAGGRRNFNDQHDDGIISNNPIKSNGYSSGRMNPNVGMPNNNINNSYPSNQYGESSQYGGGRLDRQRFDNESRPHPNQHVSNAYHQQAGHVRNQQYSYNNNNTNTRYLPAENGFINTNNVMMQRNDQGGFDAPHIQNGYVNQRNPPSQYHYQQPNQVQPAHMGPSSGGLRIAGVLLDERVPGVVKWYNFKNGFGFVTRNDNHQDIFVHRSGILGNSSPGLDDGEPVEFDVYQDGNRILAVNISGPNGTNLRGSKYASNNMPFNSGGNMNAPAKVYRRRKEN